MNSRGKNSPFAEHDNRYKIFLQVFYGPDLQILKRYTNYGNFNTLKKK
jgi:hypothetical protein